MASHTKGYKYILSASVSNEVGTILEERNKLHGVVKSFEVEQALRQYYGLESLKNLEGSKVSSPATQPAVSEATPTTTTTNPDAAGTTIAAVDKLRDMATDDGGSQQRLGGDDVDANRKKGITSV